MRLRHPIAIIVVAQLFGTSLWFSPNSVADDLARAWRLAPADIGLLTGAVQLGFIAGTLGLALTGLADRYRASRIFLVSALAGAALNAAFALAAGGLGAGLALRFAVGVCIAGIYPLGMKLVISWTPGRAGATLGLLIGMLTAGTALPHGVRAAGIGWPWQAVVLSASVLAVASGLAVAALGDGPHAPQPGGRTALRWGAALQAFRDRTTRAAALGYFGHMWELYAFWTVTPFLVALAWNGPGLQPTAAAAAAPPAPWVVPAWSFAIIAIGGVGSVLAGIASRRIGSPAVAAWALAGSGTCCLLFPLAAPVTGVAMVVLLVWGLAVVADSAQFSATTAASAPPHLVGSVLALQNSAGFLITVVAIAVATAAIGSLGAAVAWLLAPGPALGLLALRPLLGRRAATRRLDAGERP